METYSEGDFHKFLAQENRDTACALYDSKNPWGKTLGLFKKLTSDEIEQLDAYLKNEIRLGFTYEINENAIIIKCIDKKILFKICIFQEIKKIHDYEVIKFTDEGFMMIFHDDIFPKNPFKGG